MDTKPMNTCRILSESKRIIVAKYTHFVTLSLFFLPHSFLLMTDYQLFTINQKPGYQPIFYMLLANIPALCSAGTIAYSTHHAFFGEPLTLSASIKSLTSTFFPLFWTSIVAGVLIFLIMLTFLLFVGVILMLLQSLGFVVIDYNNLNFFTWFPLVVGVVLIVIVLYFQVSWSLAYVVVVVESKWGFAALKRSSYLVKGMRSVSLLIHLYFGICGGLMAWICSANVFNISGGLFVFLIVLGTIFMMMILLRNIAANTVLYNFCKVLHDVSLPYDYEKVSTHVVAVSVA